MNLTYKTKQDFTQDINNGGLPVVDFLLVIYWIKLNLFLQQVTSYSEYYAGKILEKEWHFM